MQIAEERVFQAVQAVKRGWRVIPLQGKRPVMSGWQDPCEVTETEASTWAMAGNYGVVTGEKDGVVVVDVDDSKHIEPMMKKYPTVTALTGRGCHLYFATPPVIVKNAVGIADGVDFRGVGGQVVGVGSVHPEHGGIYRWAPGRGPGEFQLAPLPHHIMEMVCKDKSSVPPTTPVNELPDDYDVKGLAVYDRVAITEECLKLKGVGSGGRNHALNTAAFNLGQLVGAGRLPRALVVQELIIAAQHNGLWHEDGEEQCMQTIVSGLEGGLASPRATVVTAGKAEPEAIVDESTIEIVYLDDESTKAEKPEWYIPNLVRKSGFHLVWAQPGGYKTNFTVRVALELLAHKPGDDSHCLCKNTDWRIVEGMNKVLFITTEETPAELKNVLDMAEAGFGTKLDRAKRLGHVYAHQLKRDESITVNDLRGLVDLYGPFDMVVLDSLTGLRPKTEGVKWDVDNEAANIMCLMLRRFLAERKMALWVIHHSDKLVKNYRGPTEWWASADVMFGLLKHHDKDENIDLLRVKPQKVRGGRVLGDCLLLPEWTDNSLDLAPWKTTRKISAKAIELLDQIERDSHANDGPTRKALLEMFDGSPTTFKAYMKVLLDNGLVEQYLNTEVTGQPVCYRKIGDPVT